MEEGSERHSGQKDREVTLAVASPRARCVSILPSSSPRSFPAASPISFPSHALPRSNPPGFTALLLFRSSLPAAATSSLSPPHPHPLRCRILLFPFLVPSRALRAYIGAYRISLPSSTSYPPVPSPSPCHRSSQSFPFTPFPVSIQPLANPARFALDANTPRSHLLREYLLPALTSAAGTPSLTTRYPCCEFASTPPSTYRAKATSIFEYDADIQSTSHGDIGTPWNEVVSRAERRVVLL
ncbi:hypothetical protein C8R44DRAFT_883693 [Mycena epipterygia]|nr:hypothetical protein C8R44DRAFT_883693 [Mycena epipterygia]